ncbi:hypothetical protein MFIFM68171_08373 [Madurella fahalii]|uniref:Uncharacterized protein n=1 Tax=Madurella fahalii TaxID=1157608 RepID=A0ABQ0GK71_9PEZI
MISKTFLVNNLGYELKRDVNRNERVKFMGATGDTAWTLGSIKIGQEFETMEQRRRRCDDRENTAASLGISSGTSRPKKSTTNGKLVDTPSRIASGSGGNREDDSNNLKKLRKPNITKPTSSTDNLGNGRLGGPSNNNSASGSRNAGNVARRGKKPAQDTARFAGSKKENPPGPPAAHSEDGRGY